MSHTTFIERTARESDMAWKIYGMERSFINKLCDFALNIENQINLNRIYQIE